MECWYRQLSFPFSSSFVGHLWSAGSVINFSEMKSKTRGNPPSWKGLILWWRTCWIGLLSGLLSRYISLLYIKIWISLGLSSCEKVMRCKSTYFLSACHMSWSHSIPPELIGLTEQQLKEFTSRAHTTGIEEVVLSSLAKEKMSNWRAYSSSFSSAFNGLLYSGKGNRHHFIHFSHELSLQASSSIELNVYSFCAYLL